MNSLWCTWLYHLSWVTIIIFCHCFPDRDAASYPKQLSMPRTLVENAGSEPWQSVEKILFSNVNSSTHDNDVLFNYVKYMKHNLHLYHVMLKMKAHRIWHSTIDSNSIIFTELIVLIFPPHSLICCQIWHVNMFCSISLFLANKPWGLWPGVSDIVPWLSWYIPTKYWVFLSYYKLRSKCGLSNQRNRISKENKRI